MFRISDRVCERVRSIFLAPFVALIVLHSFKEAFEVSRLVPRVQISNRIFQQVVEVLVPQVAAQFVARCVAVSFLQSFEETVEPVTLVSLVHRCVCNDRPLGILLLCYCFEQLKDNCEVGMWSRMCECRRGVVIILWRSRFHKRQLSLSHVLLRCQCLCFCTKPLRWCISIFMCKVPRTCVYRIVTSPFHKFQGSMSHVLLMCQCCWFWKGTSRRRAWFRSNECNATDHQEKELGSFRSKT